jgi:ribosomal protein S18 acetylase RimI-like enzyme
MESPSSLTLRVASVKDALAVARVHLGAWRSAYRGIIPDSYLDGVDEEARASRYTFDRTGPDDPLTWIAVEGDEIVGFVSVGPARGDERGRGEIYALYVAPSSWRSGIGSVLMTRAEEHLAGQGFDEALLWVLKDNDRGRRFYEAVGWRDDGGELTAVFDSHEVVEVRYAKPLRAFE